VDLQPLLYFLMDEICWSLLWLLKLFKLNFLGLAFIGIELRFWQGFFAVNGALGCLAYRPDVDEEV